MPNSPMPAGREAAYRTPYCPSSNRFSLAAMAAKPAQKGGVWGTSTSTSPPSARTRVSASRRTGSEYHRSALRLFMR